MTTLTSVKLDAKTRSLLKRLAKERGETQSEVIRAGILALAEDATLAKEEPFAHRFAHVIGCLDSGGAPSRLSRDTGRRYAEAMSQKHRGVSPDPSRKKAGARRPAA